MSRFQITSISLPLAAAALMLLPGCTTANSRNLDNGQKLSQRGESISDRGAEWADGQREMTDGQKLIAQSEKKRADGRNKLGNANDDAGKAQRQIDEASADRLRLEQMIAAGTQQMSMADSQKLIAQSEKKLTDGRNKLRNANDDAVKEQRQIDEANADQVRGEQMVTRGTQQMNRAEADYQQIRNDGPAIQPR